MSKNHIVRRGLNKLSDAVSSALGHDTDPTANLIDPASEGDGELTGPELAAARAREDNFADLDDWGTDSSAEPEATYVAPDPEPARVPMTATAAIDGLAKTYILKGLESFQRTPSPNISDAFRAQLLHTRELLKSIHAAGVRGTGRILTTMVGVLAIDQRGKIEAVSFLRSLQRQAVWQASVDIARARRAEARGQRRAGEEDEHRDAPIGMDGMSDHSDAIAGMAGSSEAVEVNEYDATTALVEVNGVLSALADSLCDDANDRTYLGLDSGLAYLDKPGLVPGSWVGVYDVDEAIDIQLIKNQESMVKRDEERAKRRRAQLALLGGLLDGR